MGATRRARSPRRGPRAGLAALVLAASLPAAADQLVLTASADTSLFEDNDDFSNGSGSLFIGNIASGSPRRTLLRFDTGALPAGATVTAVSLRFYINRAAIGSGPAEPAALYRVTAAWGEGGSATTAGTGTQATATDATWAYRVYGNPGAGAPRLAWSTPGGDFITAASATTPVGSIGSYTFRSTPQLVADVQGWLANPGSNAGWLLQLPEGGDQNARRIDSRESAAITNRPVLTITYATAPDNEADVPLPAWAIAVAGLLLGGTGLRQLRRRA
jgi:hypothetical protein